MARMTVKVKIPLGLGWRLRWWVGRKLVRIGCRVIGCGYVAAMQRESFTDVSASLVTPPVPPQPQCRIDCRQAVARILRAVGADYRYQERAYWIDDRLVSLVDHDTIDAIRVILDGEETKKGDRAKASAAEAGDCFAP